MFDTNSPIVTPTWLNTIDLSAPTSKIVRVKPSTANVTTTVRRHTRTRRMPVLQVFWKGIDRYSGVATYDIYAAARGRRFKKVLWSTPTSGGSFLCMPGRKYRFYVVAYSAVGNAQIGHSRPSASVKCR